MGALLLGGRARLGARAARLPPAPRPGRAARGARRAGRRPAGRRASASGLAWLGRGRGPPDPGARELREPVQRSAILRELNEILPPSGPILKALARFDPFPRIDGPAPGVGAPGREDRARPGGASRRRQRGEGAGDRVRPRESRAAAGSPATAWWSRTPTWWPGRTTPRSRSAARVRATTPTRSVFDATNDLAILRSSGIAGTPVAAPGRRTPTQGTSAAILGFPENGPYDVQPGRLGQTQTVTTQDAYGRGPGPAQHHLAARPRALRATPAARWWTARGAVVTTIFAATVDDGGGSGFGVPDVDRARRARQRGRHRRHRPVRPLDNRGSMRRA